MRGRPAAERCAASSARPGSLQLSERMLDLDALTAEVLIESTAVLSFCCASCLCDGHLWRLVGTAAATMMLIGNISEKLELRTQPWHAEIEGNHLARAHRWIASIDDTEAACAGKHANG